MYVYTCVYVYVYVYHHKCVDHRFALVYLNFLWKQRYYYYYYYYYYFQWQ